jgi:phosphoglycerate dehydrogenase-like enzyme
MAGPDVLVLRQDVHGIPVAEYAAAIRERLPDHEVAHARTPAEERNLIAEATVVTGHALGDDLLERATALELFACLYAGVDHLPLAALEARSVAVTNASGVHGPNAAAWAVGQILTFARGLHTGWQRQARREFRHFQAGELAGSTVTVVGMGAIGEAVLERLSGFGVETVGVRHSPGKGGPADEVVGYDEEAFHGVLARTDYLVLACPLTELTRGLVDAEALSTLPPTAVVLNLARGPVVDTDALVSTIRLGGLRGAALDVTDPEPLPPDHPLWTFENVLITPHVAGQTPHYYERRADVLAENVRALDDGAASPLRNQVV